MCDYKGRRHPGRTTGWLFCWEGGAALGQVNSWACGGFFALVQTKPWLTWSSVSSKPAFGKRLDQRPPKLPPRPISYFDFQFSYFFSVVLTLDFSSLSLTFLQAHVFSEVWTTSRTWTLTPRLFSDQHFHLSYVQSFLTKSHALHLNVCSVTYNVPKAMIS